MEISFTLGILSHLSVNSQHLTQCTSPSANDSPYPHSIPVSLPHTHIHTHTLAADTLHTQETFPRALCLWNDAYTFYFLPC